jgi:hypothetical protein
VRLVALEYDLATPGSFAHFFIVRIVPKRSRLSSAVTNVRSVSSGGQKPICGIALWEAPLTHEIVLIAQQLPLPSARRPKSGMGRCGLDTPLAGPLSQIVITTARTCAGRSSQVCGAARHTAGKIRRDLIDGTTASARRSLEPLANQGGHAAPGRASLLPQVTQRRIWKLDRNPLHHYLSW